MKRYRHTFQKDDIVVTKLGDPLGKACFIPSFLEYGIIVADVVRVRITHNHVSHKFIHFAINSENSSSQLKKLTKGTTRPRVNLGHIRKLEIPLPPINEQQRIVSKIEELFTRLDAGIESLKQVQTLLNKYRQSVLKSAVEGKLTSEFRKQNKDELKPADKLLDRILKERKEKWETEQLANFKAKGKEPPKNWQRKYKEPTPPDTTKLPELPDGWVWVKSDQLFSYVTSGSRGWKKFYSDKGSNFIRTQDINTNKLCMKEVAKVSLPNKVEGKRSLVKQWDLLSIITGANYGKVALVTEPIGESYVSQSVALIRLADIKIAKYLHLSMISEDKGSTQLQKLAYGMGRPVLNLQNVKDLNIPLPPLEEQEKIVEKVEQHFSIIDESEKMIEAELKRSQSLRQSILKHAFEGKLVPQDPNDEHASVLLEKIKAEKSNPIKSKQMEMF